MSLLFAAFIGYVVSLTIGTLIAKPGSPLSKADSDAAFEARRVRSWKRAGVEPAPADGWPHEVNG